MAVVDANDSNDLERTVAASGGRERRQHGRWRVEGAFVLVDELNFPLVDISIGGFQAQSLDQPLLVGQSLRGTVVRSQGKTRTSLDFIAQIVRVDDDSDMFAAAFDPLEGQQIDRLLKLLSGIEAERREEYEREQRRRDRGRSVTRLMVTGGVLVALLVAGYAGWAVIGAMQ